MEEAQPLMQQLNFYNQGPCRISWKISLLQKYKIFFRLARENAEETESEICQQLNFTSKTTDKKVLDF